MINRNIRKNIYNNTQKIKELFYLEDFCNLNYGDYILEQYFNHESREEFVIAYFELSVMFSDLYKILSEKRKSNFLNSREENLFFIMNNVSSLEDFIKVARVIFDSGKYLTDSTNNFHEMNAFGKIYLHKSLNDEEKKFLNEICPTFEEDLNMYNQNFSLEEYWSYYEKYLKHFKDSGYIDIKDRFNCMEVIENYFVKLLTVDIEKGNLDVFDELSRYFVDMNNFLKKNGCSHGLEIDLNKCVYQNMYDKEFIKKAIGFFIEIKSTKKDGVYVIDNFSFSDDEFEEFKASNSKIKLKK